MKNLLLLALTIVCLASSCGDDDSGESLRLDGDNVSAPLLDPDTYQAAVRFSSTLTTPYSGFKLTEVDYYILDAPGSCKIIIYDEAATGTGPGDILFTSPDLTGRINGADWNTYTLPTPIELSGDDLWIAVEVDHPSSLRTVGCDAGPAQSNGDWVLASTVGQWQTLRDFTSDAVSINWNIRGILSED
ncbi:MAG: hypothetical protein AB8F74_19510 [Saprospiraceae bacterium]